MNVVNRLLTAGAAAASLGSAAPVAAQYYPPAYSGYPPTVPAFPGYGRYGYSPYGYDQRHVTNSCVRAIQARLNGDYDAGYEAYGYGRGRVVAITKVELRESERVWRVMGLASGGYGQGADINWACRADFRGIVVDVELKRGYGDNYTPWGDNSAPYGYHRY